MSLIRFTPVYGGCGDEGPVCHMLEIDECKILLNCGWDYNFNKADLQELDAIMPSISAILLSFPDVYHLGALPYMVAKHHLNIPVYATSPTMSMGELFMYDAFQSRYNEEDFTDFTLRDVDAAFELLKQRQLKYSQHVGLEGGDKGIRIVPYAAGHMIGGTIWRITTETEDIIYACGYCRRVERHLNPTVLEGFVRPSVLITDCLNYMSQNGKRSQLDTHLCEQVIATLREGGNVLIPTDTSGRVLEILLILEGFWSKNNFANFPLCFLSNLSKECLLYAQDQLAWMSDSVLKKMNATKEKENPFQFRYVRPFDSLSYNANDHLVLQSFNKSGKLENEIVLPGPCVILATTNGLDTGYARHLFMDWVMHKKNKIILLDKGPPKSLTRQLYDGVRTGTLADSLPLVYKCKKFLEGQELQDFYDKERKEQEEAARAVEEENARAAEDEENGGGGGIAATTAASSISDLMLGTSSSLNAAAVTTVYGLEKIEEETKIVMQGHGFECAIGSASIMRSLKPLTASKQRGTSALAPMFPYVQADVDFDEYGEVINPFDYIPKDNPQDDMAMLWGENDHPNMHNAMGKTAVEDDADTLQHQMLPTKCLVISDLQLPIHGTIVYIDLEGRADGSDIRNIISKVQPRKLVTVRGSDAAVNGLKQFLSATFGENFPVAVPARGVRVDLVSDINMKKVHLSEAVLDNLNWQQAGDYQIAWIDGQLETPAPAAAVESTIPVLQPWTEGKKAPFHSAVYMNDIRLSEFKQVLAREGFKVVFKDNSLICNNTIRLKKADKDIVIEGPISRDYFKVRALLYKQFAIV